MPNGEEDVVFDEEATPQDNLKKIRERLKKAVEEKQDYLQGWQRAKADFVNFKRDAEERVADSRRYGAAEVIEELIPLLDQFDMAVAAPQWNEAPEGFRKGMEGIRKGLHKVLESHGVISYNPIGEPFDPVRHEPLSTAPTNDPKKDQVVVQALQPGYIQNGKILRPAKVVIGEFHQK